MRIPFTIFVTSLTVAVSSVEAGLLAYYPFDSDFSDASGNGNHLTIGAGTPAISTIADEIAGGAGALDINSTTGDQSYLALPNAITFGASDTWSVAFWARHRPENDGRTGMILGDLTSSDFIWIPRDGAVAGLRFRNTSNQNADYTSPPAGIEPAGIYHHWAIIADGAGSIEIFYDNVSLGTRAFITTLNITSIGQAFSLNTQSMNGQIDELHIYDEAIDATKIDDLFTGNTGPDTTPPTLNPSGITDDRDGGPIAQGSPVTYTVNFDEDMDTATVTLADFENAGSSSITIGNITEATPGVFTVPVTPTSTGTLRLRIPVGAILDDVAGNPLDTSLAILDDTTFNVIEADNTPPSLTANDFVDNQAGGPVVENTLVTYTVSFSEDMDATTVDTADFGNAGSAPFTISPVSEISPGVFSVTVTPTGPGTLALEVIATAELRDISGNLLDTDSAIVDNTTITVEAIPSPPQITRIHVYLLGGQSNADGQGSPSGLPTSPINLQQAQDDVDFFYSSTLTTLRPLSLFGPEITMGRRLSDSIATGATERVAIIKYASGGTSLAVDWKPGGDATTTGDGPFYVTFQQRVTSGLAALASAYPNAQITINGMLWVQGERDAKGGFENDYEANLTTFIADLRATFSENLPFIISRLSSEQTNIPATQLAIVRAAQSAVADADPRSSLLDTDGFGMKTDNLHFDALGQQQIGNASAVDLLKFAPFDLTPTFTPLQNGDFEVKIENAFPGFLYTLQSNPTLQPGNWTNEETITAATSRVVFTFTPPTDDSHRFFRVGRSASP